jgi:hypothetical protein
MFPVCMSTNCFNVVVDANTHFCSTCIKKVYTEKIRVQNESFSNISMAAIMASVSPPPAPEVSRQGRRHTDRPPEAKPMSEKYPKYYKPVPKGVDSLDIYAICQMFPVDDASGAINHARKKLLIPGTRTGGKSLYADIKEARDTLTRWLELNEPKEDTYATKVDTKGYIGGFGLAASFIPESTQIRKD